MQKARHAQWERDRQYYEDLKELETLRKVEAWKRGEPESNKEVSKMRTLGRAYEVSRMSQDYYNKKKSPSYYRKYLDHL